MAREVRCGDVIQLHVDPHTRLPGKEACEYTLVADEEALEEAPPAATPPASCGYIEDLD